MNQMNPLMKKKRKKKTKIEYYYEDIPTFSKLRSKLWERVEEFTGHPLLVDWSAKLIKKYNVPERNDLALARAVQKYSQDHIKFFRERPERFASPLRTIAWGFGDCDDKSVFIASVLRSFRIPVRLKFIRFYSKEQIKMVSHVYPQAKINGKWIALESVHKWDIGDDPEERAKMKGIKPEVHIIGDK